MLLSDVNWQMLILQLVAMTIKLLPATLPTFWWLNYISRPNIKRGMSRQSLSKQWKLSYKNAIFRAYILQLFSIDTSIERTFCTLVKLALIVRLPLLNRSKVISD